MKFSAKLFGLLLATTFIAYGCQTEESFVAPDEQGDDLYEVLSNFNEEVEYYGFASNESTENARSWGSWKKKKKKQWYKKRPTFKTLTVALAKTNLISTVVRGDITVFAPSDEAFAKLGINQRNVGSIPNLKDILLYHVLGTEVYSTDLTNGCFSTVAGKDIRVDLTDGVFINSSQVIKADVKAFKGVFHIVDNVLFAPDKNLAEVAISNPNFSILVEAVSRVGLVSALTGDDNLTVFAPTNDAFLALLEELGASSLADIDDETLTSVLLYHVVAGKVCSNDLMNGQRVTTLNGGSFNVDLNNLSLGDANGRSAGLVANSLNLQATNGVIHVIDKVILPPMKNIAEIAQGNENFSILVDALSRVDLVGAVAGADVYTVFAPTNDAFVALLGELGATSLDDIDDETLTAVLLYHVVPGRVYSNDLSNGLMASTLNGGSLTFDLTGDPQIVDARGRVSSLETSLLNLQATNGVVHVINKVLLP